MKRCSFRQTESFLELRIVVLFKWVSSRQYDSLTSAIKVISEKTQITFVGHIDLLMTGDLTGDWTSVRSN